MFNIFKKKAELQNFETVLPSSLAFFDHYESIVCGTTTRKCNALEYDLLSDKIRCRVVCKESMLYSTYSIYPDSFKDIPKLLRMESWFIAYFKNNNVRVFQREDSVVIEVTKKQSPIFLGDMIQLGNDESLNIPVGIGADGQEKYIDIADAPHLLVSGTTGSGKSILLQNIIIQLLCTHTPSDLQLTLVDPKQVEFNAYESLPNVSCVYDSAQAVSILDSLCNKMDDRYTQLRNLGFRDIKELHNDGKKMNYEVVVIDELADLMSTNKKGVENSIQRLCQKGRACGIHLVVATQYPKADIVTTKIKANIPTRICLHVTSHVESNVILGMSGGQKLRNHGDLLLLENGSTDPIRCQSPLVTMQEINNVVGYLQWNVPQIAQQRINRGISFGSEF